MLLYFNRNGQLLEALEYGSVPRAGTTNFKIIAFFENVDILTDYSTATIDLVKPDLNNSSYPTMLMTRNTNFVFDSSIEESSHFTNGTSYNVYEFNFSSVTSSNDIVVLLDTPGQWTATITLVNSSGTYVQGTVTMNVQNGVSNEDETQVALETILNQIYQAMGDKLNKTSNFFLRVINSSDIPSTGSSFSSDLYSESETYVLFTKDTHKFYLLDGLTVSDSNPTEIALDLSEATIDALTSTNIVTSHAYKGSASTDNEYVTLGEGDSRYINTTGDTMTGLFTTSAAGIKLATGDGWKIRQLSDMLYVSFEDNNVERDGIILEADKFAPATGSTVDLGEEVAMFKDLYLDGELKDDYDNSISIAGIVNKVDKTNTANQVYATDNSGNQTTIGYGTNNSAGNIVQRDSNAEIMVNTTPIDNNASASKIYVDSEIASAVAPLVAGVKGDNETDYRTGNVNITKGNIGLANVLNVEQLPASEKGVANGVATLDNNAKVPLSQLPDSVLGQVEYCGNWDASSSSSQLTQDHTLRKGDYYICSTSGNYNPDGISTGISYVTGDWAIYDGSAWEKIDNTDAVQSVNGYTGAVVLSKSDIGLANVDNTSDLNKPISTAMQTALDLKLSISSASEQYQTKIIKRDFNSIASSSWTQDNDTGYWYYTTESLSSTLIGANDIVELYGKTGDSLAGLKEYAINIDSWTTTVVDEATVIDTITLVATFQPEETLVLGIAITKDNPVITNDITWLSTDDIDTDYFEYTTELSLKTSSTPTEDSILPITSGGVYSALNNLQLGTILYKHTITGIGSSTFVIIDNNSNPITNDSYTSRLQKPYILSASYSVGGAKPILSLNANASKLTIGGSVIITRLSTTTIEQATETIATIVDTVTEL